MEHNSPCIRFPMKIRNHPLPALPAPPLAGHGAACIAGAAAGAGGRDPLSVLPASPALHYPIVSF
jgi:hypothetical protein